MKRYLRLFLSFARFGLAYALEYRVNFLIWAVSSTMWAGIFVLSVELIFGQVESIAGWTKNETLLLAAVQALFVGLLWYFVFPNLTTFYELVRKGDLDFYLIKPVDHRFLVSTKKVEFDQFLRTAVLIGYIAAVILQGHLIITWLSLAAFLLVLFLGLVIFYNVFFILAIFSFWLINVHNYEDLFHNLLDLGRFPTQIYKDQLGIFLTFFVPVAYVATFPVQAFLGKLEPVYFLAAVFLAISSSLISQWFWNFALKNYTSASS